MASSLINQKQLLDAIIDTGAINKLFLPVFSVILLLLQLYERVLREASRIELWPLGRAANQLSGTQAAPARVPT